MSYIDDLNQAATEALAASSSATESAQIMFDVANGADNVTVTTDGGEVKTVAKAIKDIIDSIEVGVEAPQVEPQTLSASQTTVTLTTMTTEGIALYIEGSREFDFTVTNNTDFELSQSFPDGTRIWIVKRDIEGTADSFTVNTSTGSQTLSDSLDSRGIWVEDLAALKAIPLAGLVPDQKATITTTGRAGDFTWFAGDQSANVASDPQEGVWVAPDGGDGSNGAWGRVVTTIGKFNVKWFGATGDGLTDDSTAIQAAINAAELLVSGYQGGGAVFFPHGKYKILSTLSISSGGVSLYSDSVSTSIEYDGSDWAIRAKHSLSDTVLYSASIRNLTISGGANPLGGVLASSAHNFVLENVAFRAFSNPLAWCVAFDTSNNVYSQNNNLYNCQGLAVPNGVRFGLSSDTWPVNCSSMYACRFTGVAKNGNGVSVENGNNVSIDLSCDLEGWNRGVFAGPKASVVHVRKSTIEQNNQGIYLDAAQNCLIDTYSTGNTVSNFTVINGATARYYDSVNGREIKYGEDDFKLYDLSGRMFLGPSNLSVSGGASIEARSASYPTNPGSAVIAAGSTSGAGVRFATGSNQFRGQVDSDGNLNWATSAWDAGHFVLGPYHLWVDSVGRLRIKNGAPTSDGDGAVVGAQT